MEGLRYAFWSAFLFGHIVTGGTVDFTGAIPDGVWYQETPEYADMSDVSDLGLVMTYFNHDDIGRAMKVIECESNFNPDAKNPNSTASGLFQHLASQWPTRSVSAGWEGYSVFDRQANVAVAAWLVYKGGGWSHWNASKGCWGGKDHEYQVETVDLVSGEVGSGVDLLGSEVRVRK